MLGIGIVGAGAIVRAAHLPAYKKAGYNVRAIYDRDQARARELANEFGIPHCCASVEEMLKVPHVSVVDVAVPPVSQPAIARAAMAAGKHLLCQKPLAEDWPLARDLVREAEQAGVKLAVNQQMRWDPLIRTAHQLLHQGVLGCPVNAALEVSVTTDWAAWTWIPSSPRLDLMLHSIHYFDSMRFLFGDPLWVFSALGKWPGQKEVAETRSQTTLSFPGEVLVHVGVNHYNWADDQFATFRLEGTEGIIRGVFGHLKDYPYGEPDTLEYCTRANPSWVRKGFDEKWFPDAFAGPMGSLLGAVEKGGEPETSGRDNLQTLALVLAGYRSAEEKRSVRLDEITNP